MTDRFYIWLNRTVTILCIRMFVWRNGTAAITRGNSCLEWACISRMHLLHLKRLHHHHARVAVVRVHLWLGDNMRQDQLGRHRSEELKSIRWNRDVDYDAAVMSESSEKGSYDIVG